MNSSEIVNNSIVVARQRDVISGFPERFIRARYLPENVDERAGKQIFPAKELARRRTIAR